MRKLEWAMPCRNSQQAGRGREWLSPRRYPVDDALAFERKPAAAIWVDFGHGMAAMAWREDDKR